MWYVTRLDDSFGKYPLPDALFDSLPVLRMLTWATLIFETSLPIGLWVPRTRMLALSAAFLFHVSLEYTMNLFLFHLLMLVGLIPFLATDRRFLRRRTDTAGSRNEAPPDSHASVSLAAGQSKRS